MSKCKLDLDNPKFRIIGSANDADRDAGLRELRDKVAKDHKLCHFIIHPMPRFPDYQNKIWKWDFAPVGQTSSTRAGWRLLAYVPDPSGDEPIEAIAFVCWDKGHEPSGNPAKAIAKILKKFLEKTFEIAAVEERFKRQLIEGNTAISLCLTCFQTVGIAEMEELDILESAHQCDPEISN